MHTSIWILRMFANRGQYRQTRNITQNDTKRHMSDTCPKKSRPEATQKDTNPKNYLTVGVALLLKKASMSLRLSYVCDDGGDHVMMVMMSVMVMMTMM